MIAVFRILIGGAILSQPLLWVYYYYYIKMAEDEKEIRNFYYDVVVKEIFPTGGRTIGILPIPISFIIDIKTKNGKRYNTVRNRVLAVFYVEVLIYCLCNYFGLL